MKKTFKRVLLSMALAAFGGSIASAAAVDCSGVSDVTALVDGCYASGSPSTIFSNFTVTPSAGFTAATIGITSTSVSGGDINLNFSIGGITGTGAISGNGDILLEYGSTALTGVDLSLQATPLTEGGFMRITEIVCDQPFSGSTCNGNTLANISATSTGNTATASGTFALTGPVYIKKDIQFNGATTSEFSNSQLTAVPEPVTFSMVGLGLLGLGLAGRRYAKR